MEIRRSDRLISTMEFPILVRRYLYTEPGPRPLPTNSYNDLLLKSGFDSFRIYAVKSLMIELFKILEGMTPDYLSELFVKADNPYDTRDKCKLIQPLKRTITYGLRSFQYYGAHVWNMLPINIKAAQSLHEFKSFIRSWPGPTCSCHICTALL